VQRPDTIRGGHDVTGPVGSACPIASVQMTALNLASIPSSINSYERLLVWAMQTVQNIANGEEVNVTSGTTSQPIAQVQVGFTADGVYRFILSGYIPCDEAELNAATAKTWMAAQDISNAAPHSNFLTN
jgi:hypothetical protein